MNILRKLQGYHAELLKLEHGKEKLADNPVLAGEYQGKLRLEVNRLFAYMNVYVDLLADITAQCASEREGIYKSMVAIGKSPNASSQHASEMTKVLSANEKIAKFRVDQIKNEYERYNGIAIYLATRMKEFNSERMMG